MAWASLPFSVWIGSIYSIYKYMSIYIHIYILISFYIHLYVYVLPFQYIQFLCIHMENGANGNGNFCLFAENGERKRQTSICYPQTPKTKNGSLFSLVSKRWTVIDVFFSKRAHLCLQMIPAHKRLLYLSKWSERSRKISTIQ